MLPDIRIAMCAHTRTPRQGFTLTEVAFALGIIVSTVTVLLILISNALRQSQYSRDQLLGAAVAARVAESFATGGDVVFNGHLLGDGEANIAAARDPVRPLQRMKQNVPRVNDPRNYSENTKLLASAIATGRLAGDQLRRNPIYGVAGQFDLEHRLVGPEGFLRPIPLAIAHRIDSPGNAIANHLAEGGQIYYVAPDALDGGASDPGALADSTLKDNLGRLIVAFVGPAQQNLLPYHPTQLPPQRLYPFPPALGSPNVRHKNDERPYGTIPRSWAYPSALQMGSVDSDWGGLSGVLSFSHPEWYPQVGGSLTTFLFDWGVYDPNDLGDPGASANSGLRGPGNPAGIRRAFIERSMGQSYASDSLDDEPNIRGGFDWRVWHWFATDIDTRGDMHADKRWEHDADGSWQDIWKDHVGGFAELTIDYFQRLLHQIDNARLQGEDLEPYTDIRHRRIPADPPTREEEIEVRRRYRLPGGDWETRIETRTITVPIFTSEPYEVVIIPEPGGVNHRGIPAPPAGTLDAMTPYEDYWPGQIVADLSEDDDDPDYQLFVAASQIRTGLPGLEQRRKFRDRAIEFYNDIVDDWGHGEKFSDSNPQDTVFSTPADSMQLHPAQILALNYVAYASTMVTGYKRPFVGRFNDPDAGNWRDMADVDGDDTEERVYRTRTEDDYRFAFINGAFYLPYRKPHASPGEEDDDQDLPEAVVSADDHDVPPDIFIQQRLGDVDRREGCLAAFWLGLDGHDDIAEIDDIEQRIADDTLTRTIDGNYIYYHEGDPADASDSYQKRIFYETGDNLDGDTWEIRRTVTYRQNSAADGDPATWVDIAAVTIQWSQAEAQLSYGPVINPFPPPYADDTDMKMAQTAMANLITYLNAYVAVRPHCHIVPKPLNRQTSWDQGLYAKDPFFGRDIFSSDFNDGGGGAFAGAYQDSIGMMMWGNHDALFVPDRFSHFGAPWHQSLNYGREGEEFVMRAAIAGRGLARYDITSDQRIMQVAVDAIRKTRSRGEMSGRWWFTRPFEVADRTRQMVVWSAPWQSYEDFESAIAAPVDFSHLAIGYRQDSGQYHPVTNQYAHPEERVAFANPARDATIYRLPPDRHLSEHGTDQRSHGDGSVEYDMGFSNIHYNPGRDWHRRMIWAALGLWGADRNGNGQFDRGPLPVNQRIRASEVGRYVVYDPVMWVPVR